MSAPLKTDAVAGAFRDACLAELEALKPGNVHRFSDGHDMTVADFVAKVRSGAPVTTANPVFHYRGRMPVFPYLQDVEVAAAYMFLIDYPPQAGDSKRQ